ncbi:MAG: DUF2165 family protein [Anaerolineae bacterium]
MDTTFPDSTITYRSIKSPCLHHAICLFIIARSRHRHSLHTGPAFQLIRWNDATIRHHSKRTNRPKTYLRSRHGVLFLKPRK